MDIFNEKHVEAAKELIYKMADDLVIIGHRNSEWTGLGPILEEDIAFSSMAQDKLGQSMHLYGLLSDLGESDPDTIAFTRNSNDFHCNQLVELPIGDYAFSTIRHFLFDYADLYRFSSLINSSHEELANRARKFVGEIKYHSMHAKTWVIQLGQGNDESKSKMQKALDESWNLALGIFENGPHESVLIESKIFEGEDAIKQKWLDAVLPILEEAGLKVPEKSTWEPVYGGRKGKHSVHLQPLLDEMTEVFTIDPGADW